MQQCRDSTTLARPPLTPQPQVPPVLQRALVALVLGLTAAAAARRRRQGHLQTTRQHRGVTGLFNVQQ